MEKNYARTTKQIIKDHDDRIKKGLSKVYPGRRPRRTSTDSYVLFNDTCTVYCRDIHRVMELDPESFTALEHSIEREIQNNRKHRHVLSYNELTPCDNNYISLMADPNAPDPKTALREKDRRDAVNAAIDQLPDIQRTIIHGLFHEYRTEKELAEILNMTSPNVHYHKERALKKLESLLYEYEEEYER